MRELRDLGTHEIEEIIRELKEELAKRRENWSIKIDKITGDTRISVGPVSRIFARGENSDGDTYSLNGRLFVFRDGWVPL